MMVEREDLGLSLSLSAFPHQNHHHPNNNNNNTLQLNLMPSMVQASASSPHSGFNPQKPSWNDALASSGLYIFHGGLHGFHFQIWLSFTPFHLFSLVFSRKQNTLGCPLFVFSLFSLLTFFSPQICVTFDQF